MYGNCVKQFKNMVLQDKIIEISGTCQSPVLAKVLPREDYMSCQVKIEDSPRTSLWVQNNKYQLQKQKLLATIAIRNTLQYLNCAPPPPIGIHIKKENKKKMTGVKRKKGNKINKR